MKKTILALLLAGLILPSFAGGVGYINYEKVLDQYQLAKTTAREIQTKADEIQNYLEILMMIDETFYLNTTIKL